MMLILFPQYKNYYIHIFIPVARRAWSFQVCVLNYSQIVFNNKLNMKNKLSILQVMDLSLT